MQDSELGSSSNRTPAKFKILLENEILKSIQKRKSLKNRFTTERKNFPEKIFTKPAKLHKNKSQGTLFQFQHTSLFDTTHKKLSSKLLRKDSQITHSAKKIRIKRSEAEKQHRVDSLENLMQKCKKINEEFKSSKVFQGYNKINQNYNKLKNTIEKIQENTAEFNSSLRSEKLLRTDSKIIRDQISYSEKLRKSHKFIWKFSSNSMKKKTERLIAAVDVKFRTKESVMV